MFKCAWETPVSLENMHVVRHVVFFLWIPMQFLSQHLSSSAFDSAKSAAFELRKAQPETRTLVQTPSSTQSSSHLPSGTQTLHICLLPPCTDLCHLVVLCSSFLFKPGFIFPVTFYYPNPHKSHACLIVSTKLRTNHMGHQLFLALLLLRMCMAMLPSPNSSSDSLWHIDIDSIFPSNQNTSSKEIKVCHLSTFQTISGLISFIKIFNYSGII